MTSLLQFHGKVDADGVHLVFMLEKPSETNPYGNDPVETFQCPECGGEHSVLHTAIRKPAGLWGHWVVFRYLGDEHVPDLSIPISVPSLPRGSVRMTDEEAADYWHS